jgi:group II intron reverse transcriptase/maturase
MEGTPSPETISTKQQRIAELARQAPEMAFNNLSHHMDINWLKMAFELTRKDGAPGVDGQTWESYRENLEENLQSLLDRAKSGTYRAPPVRRVNIPKGDGRSTRPIGIPTLEDKVLQRAVAMVLVPIYEQDFLPFSFGFRPKRSAHQALESFWKQMMSMGGGWVVEVDVQKFFDTIDHALLREAVHRRVRDGVLVRLIGKWLNAGISENGRIIDPETGTPQGGVISPLLANIFLHEVLDTWFVAEVEPRLKGRAFLIRYADDFVIGCANEEDARRVMEVLPKRFGKYGLTIHPEKTRLVPFRPPTPGKDGQGPKKPGSFDLLGFTHYWGKSRHGRWVIQRKTAKGRFRRGLKAAKEFCRRVMHWPVKEQHKKLSQKLNGHYGYFGITGNFGMLDRFRAAVRGIWRRSLARRSQRGMNWKRFERLEKAFQLPRARVTHSAVQRPARMASAVRRHEPALMRPVSLQLAAKP